MAVVAISLGSNLGDRLHMISEAVGELRTRVDVEQISPVYETAPMYVEDQPAFLNAAVIGKTELGPVSLLKFLKDIEKRIGRLPAARFGPREIDLDLISYGRAQYRFRVKGEPVLTLPHPRVVERRFVLQPLADIAPELYLPHLGQVKDLLRATDDQASSVRLVEHAVLSLLSNRP